MFQKKNINIIFFENFMQSVNARQQTRDDVSIENENNYEPYEFYNELIKDICSSLRFDYTTTLEDLDNMKKMILDSRDNVKCNAVIRYFDSCKLIRNSNRKGLIDLIIFSLRNNIQMIFKGDYEYLNLVFSKLIVFKSKKEPDLVVNNFLEISFKETKLQLKNIQNKILDVNRALYFSIAKTKISTLKNPPTSVMEMNSLEKGDLRTYEKYKLDKDITINHGYDIDGLISPLLNDQIGDAIVGDFKLELNMPRNFKPMALCSLDYHFFYGNDLIPINQCENKFIGYFNLPGVGNLKVYIIFPRTIKEKDSRSEQIWESILNIKREIITEKNDEKAHVANRISINEALKTAEGLISSDLVPTFFNSLNSKLGTNKTFFYFVEILGNKQNTVSLSFKKPISSISKYIRLDKLPGLRIDICQESWVATPHALSISPNFLAEIGFKSNYNILLSRPLNNVHSHNIKSKPIISKTQKKSEDAESEDLEEDFGKVVFEEGFEKEDYEIPAGKTLIYTKGAIEKCNFYSRYEDALAPVRCKKFYPINTLRVYDVLKNTASSISKKKLKEEITKLETIIRDLDNNSYVSYRKEIRIAPVFYMDALSIIHSDDTRDYMVVETARVNKVIKDVTIKYIDALKTEYTPIKLINLLIFEYFFQHIFLKGDYNWHYIKERLKKYLNFYRDRRIDFTEDPENNPDVFFDVDEKDADRFFCTELIVKLYYKYHMKLGNEDKIFYKIFATQTIKEGLSLIVNQMKTELCSHLEKPDLKLDKNIDKDLLNKKDPIDFFTIYKYIFESDEAWQKKTNYKIMYKIFRDWRSFTSDEIEEEFKKQKLKVFPNVKIIKKKLELVIIEYTDGSNLFSKKNNKKKAYVDVLDAFLRHSEKVYPGEVPEKEVIRAMWYEAYKSIARITWGKVCNNFFYGMPYARPSHRYSEIKKRFNGKKCVPKGYVEKMVVLALHYNPIEVTFAEIFDCIEEWNSINDRKFKCSDSFKKNYKILHELDGKDFDLPSPYDILKNLNNEFKTEITREKIEIIKKRHKLTGLQDIFDYYENFVFNKRKEIDDSSSEIDDSSSKSNDSSSEGKSVETVDKPKDKETIASKKRRKLLHEKNFEDEDLSEGGKEDFNNLNNEERYTSTDGPDFDNIDHSKWSFSYDNLEKNGFYSSDYQQLPDISSRSVIQENPEDLSSLKSCIFETGWDEKNFIDKFFLFFGEEGCNSYYQKSEDTIIPPYISIMDTNEIKEQGKVSKENETYSEVEFSNQVIEVNTLVNNSIVENRGEGRSENTTNHVINKNSRSKHYIKVNGRNLSLGLFDFLPLRVNAPGFMKRFQNMVNGGVNLVINAGDLRRGLFSKKTRPTKPVWNKFLDILTKKKVIQKTKNGRGHLISMF